MIPGPYHNASLICRHPVQRVAVLVNLSSRLLRIDWKEVIIEVIKHTLRKKRSIVYEF